MSDKDNRNELEVLKRAKKELHGAKKVAEREREKWLDKGVNEEADVIKKEEINISQLDESLDAARRQIKRVLKRDS